MDAPLRLRLLYTGAIAGDLALLPRLYSFIQGLRAESRLPALLLDLGGSCSDTAWHCRDTGGRSTLIVLDGMGYHAANVAGTLDREARDKLAPQVTMALVDEARDWVCDLPGIHTCLRVGLRPPDDVDCLRISLSPAERARVHGKVLRLQAIHAGQVGEAEVELRGGLALISAEIHTMPPDTPPNPSIAGTVEFVEAEARYFAKQARQTRTI